LGRFTALDLPSDPHRHPRSLAPTGSEGSLAAGTSAGTLRAMSWWIGTPHTLREQLARSAVAGALCGGLEWTLFGYAHLGAGMGVLAATSAGALAAILLNYLLCVHWVFKTRNVARQWLELKLFLAIGISGLGVNLLAMHLLAQRAEVPGLPAKVMASGLVVAWAFTNKKLWLFADRRAGAKESACPMPPTPSSP